jgi:hypothetical protein
MIILQFRKIVLVVLRKSFFTVIIIPVNLTKKGLAKLLTLFKNKIKKLKVYFLFTRMEILRFAERPSSVSLVATGFSCP